MCVSFSPGFRAIPSLGMLEQTWALAKWMIVPHMIAMLMIAIIGLVACLSAVVTSQNGLTACCGLCSICLMVVLMSSRLWELASITQLPGCAKLDLSSSPRRGICCMCLDTYSSWRLASFCLGHTHLKGGIQYTVQK